MFSGKNKELELEKKEAEWREREKEISGKVCDILIASVYKNMFEEGENDEDQRRFASIPSSLCTRARTDFRLEYIKHIAEEYARRSATLHYIRKGVLEIVDEKTRLTAKGEKMMKKNSKKDYINKLINAK